MKSPILLSLFASGLGLVAAELSAEHHSAAPPSHAGAGFLYGRLTTTEGQVHTGRLRFGGDEEAFWNHYFIGRKSGNRWTHYVADSELAEQRPIQVLGVQLATSSHLPELRRPLLVAMGNIHQIEAQGRALSVTLKNGTQYDLDRYEADDFADGIRIWDSQLGVMDFDEWSIRSVEFLPTPALPNLPERLYGTVYSQQGPFSGTIQWDREASTTEDRLSGIAGGESRSFPFGQIRHIERTSQDSARVSLLDGQQIVLSDTAELGERFRGINVDNPRFGRVTVSWEGFRRLELAAADSGTGYDQFAPGRALRGSVTTRDGTTHSGRIVFDLDESETTDTLDAPAGSLYHTIAFGLISVIAVHPAGADELAQVQLISGQAVSLEARGDLGEDNAGLLIFGAADRPDYIPWRSVQKVEFNHLQ